MSHWRQFNDFRYQFSHLEDFVMAARQILMLNGPNLNLLGQREPHLYGNDSLDKLEERLGEQFKQAGMQFSCFQSNSESALIDRIHEAKSAQVDYIIFNPAAFTHYSIALRDALTAVSIPFIEVHLSNVHARESFRQTSYFSDIAKGTIGGLGSLGYELAAQAIIQQLEPST